MSDEDDANTPTVPKSEHLKRIAAKQAKIDELTVRLAEVEARLTEAPDVGRLEKRLARAETERDQIALEFAAFKADSETRSALFAAGVADPEDQELVRWRHGRIPEEERPSLADYLGGAAKEDRHLRHLFGHAPESPPNGAREAEPEDGAPDTSRHAAAAPSGPKAKPGLPSANRGAKAGPPPGDTWTLEYIANLPVSERLKPENRERIAEVLASHR